MMSPEPAVSLPPGPPTRRRLHELVWTVPRMHLAARFGISDVALGKLCRSRFIPAPPNGWWTKVKMGTAPPRTELPEGLDPDEVVYVVKIPPASAPEPVLAPDVAAALAALQSAGAVVVAKDLDAPHPIVADALAWFEPKEVRRRERLAWDAPERRPCPVHIEVAETTRPRALSVLDALFRTFGSLGFDTRVESGERPGSAWTHVLGEEFDFRLREYARASALVVELRARGWYGHGRPELVRRWSDLRRTKIEDVLTEIVRAALLEGQRLREERWERERLAREAQEREKKRREEEQARFDRLTEQVERWEWSGRLRAFAAACRTKLMQETKGEGAEAMKEAADWIEWIEWNAAAMDPLRGGVERARSAVEDCATR